MGGRVWVGWGQGAGEIQKSMNVHAFVFRALVGTRVRASIEA